MEVYIEPLEPAPALYLVGAGHVSYHLAQAAHTVGFKLHVIDDREKFANTERFPNAERSSWTRFRSGSHAPSCPRMRSRSS